jgi:hypothetical protein
MTTHPIIGGAKDTLLRNLRAFPRRGGRFDGLSSLPSGTGQARMIDPIEICRLVETQFGSQNEVIPYSLDWVRTDFPEQRIYSFAQREIVEVHPRGGNPIVAHQEIYR